MDDSTSWINFSSGTYVRKLDVPIDIFDIDTIDTICIMCVLRNTEISTKMNSCQFGKVENKFELWCLRVHKGRTYLVSHI